MPDNHIIYEFANFKLIPDEEKLFQNDQEIVLEAKEFEVLLLLIKNAGTVLKKEFILSEVWGDSFVEESGVSVRISNLRRKLDPLDRKRFIKTEKKGYRFIVDVCIVEKPKKILISRKTAGKAGENEHKIHPPPEEYNASRRTEPTVTGRLSVNEQDRSNSQPVANSRQRLLFGVIAATTFIAGLISLNYAFLWLETRKPQLEEAVFVTSPVPKNQFLMRLAGKNLNPETVSLKVTGPGCGGDNPCTVPNGSLRLFGKISEGTIEKAPLTLGQGEYHIWLENDSNNVSNKLKITIPDAE